MSTTERIIVTGATGFVGSRLVPALKSEGIDVAAVVRPGVKVPDATLVIEDRGDVEALAAAFADFGATSLVHLATLYINNAQAKDIPALYEANVAFGGRVAHAFAESGGERFIYTSTFSQHQNNEEYNPTVLYAATKEAFTDVLRYYAGVGKFGVIDIELFDTFGAGDPRPKIWNLLMNAIASGETLGTTKGEQLLAPIHVDDVVGALRSALGQPTPKGYNAYFAPGPRVLSLQEAVALFEEVNDVTIPIEWGAREYNGNEMFELWTYGSELPNWKAQVSLEDGFRELWKTYQDSKQAGEK